MNPVQEIVAERIVMHPECRPEGDWKNDLALLEMQKEPQLNGKLPVGTNYNQYVIAHQFKPGVRL